MAVGSRNMRFEKTSSRRSQWRRCNGCPLMAPLKIGILGAARIADDGIVDPSRVLGHRLVAVAARDRSRAEAFAAQRGVEKVHQTYAEVIDDPEVEVVYNALVNSLHATWNQYALNAGKMYSPRSLLRAMRQKRWWCRMSPGPLRSDRRGLPLLAPPGESAAPGARHLRRTR